MGTNDTYLPDERCEDYYRGIPTFYILKKHYPNEYPVMLIVGSIVLGVNFVISVRCWKQQFGFLKTGTVLPAIRSLMIIFAFFLFPVTSLLGMLSLRSSEFLHSIVNVYESICILAFYENMRSHLRFGRFLDGRKKVLLRGGPCCCCLVCLKPAPATEQTLRRLRVAMFVTIALQMTLQILRTVRMFECSYQNGKTIAGAIVNSLMMIAFLLAMYGLVTVYRSGHEILTNYSYKGKFVAFKVMIFISKFLYSILAYVTMLCSECIPDYYEVIDGVEVLVVKDKARITIWKNFASIVMATLLLLFTHQYYNEKDYEVYNRRPSITRAENCKNIDLELSKNLISDDDEIDENI